MSGGKITERKILQKFTEIAFAPETKDSDRLRALDWLAEYLMKKAEEDTVMKRLDEVLSEIRGANKKSEDSEGSSDG